HSRYIRSRWRRCVFFSLCLRPCNRLCRISLRGVSDTPRELYQRRRLLCSRLIGRILQPRALFSQMRRLTEGTQLRTVRLCLDTYTLTFICSVERNLGFESVPLQA